MIKFEASDGRLDLKKQGFGWLVTVLALGCLMGGKDSKVFGDTEINLDDALQPTSTPVVSKSSSAKPAAMPTAIPTAAPVPTAVIQVMQAAPTPTEAVEDDSTPVIVHGVLKMKDVYEAGIKAYKEQDYDKAIRYLKKSLEMDDPYSAKFYFAEANAMLGVIYQFHIIHYSWAYRYYQAALKYEKKNRTARRHIKEVAKYRHQKG